MFRNIIDFYTSKDSSKTSLKILVSAAVIYASVSYYFRYLNKPQYEYIEEFTQKEPFVLKSDDKCYDDFYTQIYDELYNTNKRVQWELYRVLKMTQPSTTHSTFLYVGSKTGHAVYQLVEAGYTAYGVETCPKMIEYSERLFPNAPIIDGDVELPLLFERNSFTHVMCTDFMIYKMKNKQQFFKNCLQWLKPNGYLILHLVERNRFNAVSPTHDEKRDWERITKDPKTQLLKTETVFEDYIFVQQYHIPVNVDETNCVLFRETFTDRSNNNVRQNEHNLYMENIRTILEMAKSLGYLFHSKTTMKKYNDEEHQYMYILEKPM